MLVRFSHRPAYRCQTSRLAPVSPTSPSQKFTQRGTTRCQYLLLNDQEFFISTMYAFAVAKRPDDGPKTTCDVFENLFTRPFTSKTLFYTGRNASFITPNLVHQTRAQQVRCPNFSVRLVLELIERRDSLGTRHPEVDVLQCRARVMRLPRSRALAAHNNSTSVSQNLFSTKTLSPSCLH